mgnify:CR=1 FL=1
MASFITNRGARDLSVETSGTQIDWSADTIKARLVPSSVTPTKDDTSMTGLTAIGTDPTLGSKTFTEDTTNDRIVYDAADPTWTAVAGGSTVGWCVVYKFVTNDAGSTPAPTARNKRSDASCSQKRSCSRTKIATEVR